MREKSRARSARFARVTRMLHSLATFKRRARSGIRSLDYENVTLAHDFPKRVPKRIAKKIESSLKPFTRSYVLATMENNKAVAAINAYHDAVIALDQARNLLRRALADLRKVDSSKITPTSSASIHATGTIGFIYRYCGGLAKDIARDTAAGNRLLRDLKKS